ncbi:MAG: GNAT family N-acetyltransferase [Phycisphaerales bacterium]
MQIRPLQLDRDDEVAAAVNLQRAAYELEADLIGTRSIPGLNEDTAALRAAATREELFGAFEADRLVGIIGLEDEHDDSGKAVLRIARLAVDPAHFRRGIGRLLVRHVLAETHRRGVAVRVSTGAANTPGRALYESEGFTLAQPFNAPDGTPLVMLTQPRRTPMGA